VLKEVHTEEYLKRLHSSSIKVARVVELPPLAVLPMFLIDRFLLKKLRIQAGGTILAAALAIMDGWSINVGGGMHHASWNNGEGVSLQAPYFVCCGLHGGASCFPTHSPSACDPVHVTPGAAHMARSSSAWH
jgi:hypothetical protein